MQYEYHCEKCDKIFDIEQPMMEDHPKYVICECGGNAYRYWGSAKLHIPEHFQAVNEMYNGDNAGNFDYISGRLKHGDLPSGKRHAVY